jgi:hypothetical protein
MKRLDRSGSLVYPPCAALEPTLEVDAGQPSLVETGVSYVVGATLPREFVESAPGA